MLKRLIKGFVWLATTIWWISVCAVIITILLVATDYVWGGLAITWTLYGLCAVSWTCVAILEWIDDKRETYEEPYHHLMDED